LLEARELEAWGIGVLDTGFLCCLMETDENGEEFSGMEMVRTKNI
jgi:hypothetical protein